MAEFIKHPSYTEQGRSDLEQITYELLKPNRHLTGEEEDRSNELLDQFEAQFHSLIASAAKNHGNCNGVECQTSRLGRFTALTRGVCNTFTLEIAQGESLELNWNEGEFSIVRFFNMLPEKKVLKAEADLESPITIFRFNQLLCDIQQSVDKAILRC